MPIQPPGILREIVQRKLDEVAQRKAAIPMTELEAMVAQAEPPRNFFRAVTRHPTAVHFSIIAEVTRKTPVPGGGSGREVAAGGADTRDRGAGGAGGSPDSRGVRGSWIRPEYQRDDFQPENLARAYHAAGAAAISCVTDEPFFGGHLAWIERIKHAVPLPVMRKDVLVDPWQLWESRAHGADAILLIAETLSEGELLDMLILAQQLQLTAVLAVHDMDNLLRVRPHVGFPHAGYSLLAINNRDPVTMESNLAHTLRLADLVEDRSILVSEAGIENREDLLRLRSVGVRIGLVGEPLLREADPGGKLALMLKSAFEV
jgi:indole-3-glycerol phosphate synthase